MQTGIKLVYRVTKGSDAFIVATTLRRADVRAGRNKDTVATEMSARYPEAAIAFVGAVNEIHLL